jgi:hypothetical protein
MKKIIILTAFVKDKAVASKVNSANHVFFMFEASAVPECYEA